MDLYKVVKFAESYMNHDLNYYVHVILQQMLIYDPANRISAKKALNHIYFANLDKSALPASTITS